jgi:hypothetical protein
MEFLQVENVTNLIITVRENNVGKEIYSKQTPTNPAIKIQVIFKNINNAEFKDALIKGNQICYNTASKQPYVVDSLALIESAVKVRPVKNFINEYDEYRSKISKIVMDNVVVESSPSSAFNLNNSDSTLEIKNSVFSVEAILFDLFGQLNTKSVSYFY